LNALADIQSALDGLGIPVETGISRKAPPERYIVVVPLTDTFDLHADNSPGYDVQEVRLSLYSKKNYTAMKNMVVKALLDADFTITERRYIGYEADTGYFHYVVDVAKHYEMEE